MYAKFCCTACVQLSLQLVPLGIIYFCLRMVAWSIPKPVYGSRSDDLSVVGRSQKTWGVSASPVIRL